MGKLITPFAVLTPLLSLLWAAPALAVCVDNDVDGYGEVNDPDCTYPGVDCDDNDATVYPSAAEICDGIDNNCNGTAPAIEIDDDGDGAVECTWDIGGWDGDVAVTSGDDCDDGDADLNMLDLDLDGVTTCGGDCDDDDDATYPGAEEICADGIDNDCDAGTLDVDDLDEDGSACDVDCDDADASAYPGAAEACDGVDNDCDGEVGPLEIDQDGDGWMACIDCDDGDPFINHDDEDGDGFSTCNDDCDDGDPTSYPGAPELCDDGVNNDCDFDTDEMVDDDGDGFADCDDAGVVDCDDSDATVYPEAPELCDLLDNDCDDEVDEGMNDDADADGYSVCDGDCDDDAADVNIDATEVCNMVDDNCDGTVDEGYDGDNDGFVDGADSDCSANYDAAELDCDDGNSSINPDAAEDCEDEIDNNCDDLVDGEDEIECADEFPVADAGYDQQGRYLAGQVTLRFDGSGSYDPEATELIYEWTIDEEPDAGVGSATMVSSTTSPYAFLIVDITDPSTGPWDFSVALRVTEESGNGKQSDADYVRAHVYLDDPMSPPSRCSLSTADVRPTPVGLAMLFGGALLLAFRRR